MSEKNNTHVSISFGPPSPKVALVDSKTRDAFTDIFMIL